MKTKTSSQMRELRVIFIIIFWLICFIPAKSQLPTWTNLAKTATPFASEIIQYDYVPLNQHYLGIGTLNPFVPQAKFHIRQPLTLGLPAFQVEAINIGTIQNWYTNGTSNYALYESSQIGSQVFNYFQDPVQCGNIFISGSNHTATSFTTGSTVSEMKFGFGFVTPTTSDIHLTVNANGILVKSKAVMDSFQLTTNPSLGYVLVSDNLGNGNWTDVSGFVPDYWKLKDNNIYENKKYSNVGIGTDNPLQKLHIVNGNILISRQYGQTKSFGSLNGSILFGEVAYDTLPNGEWGIEYNNPGTEFNTGGLNFWKVGNPSHQGSNYNLFLRNDGDIGVGTATPQATLDVRKSRDAKIQCYTENPYSSSIWVKNSVYDYGIDVDENGIGHLIENSNSPDTIMSFHSGRVGIGDGSIDNYTTSGHKLFVTGGITTEEVTVKLKSSGWSDFIFNENYKLKSITDLEQFIKTNNHLPDIPSSQQVGNDGIELGKMNSLLLQKIEELTLYMIDQQKQINVLKEKIENKK